MATSKKSINPAPHCLQVLLVIAFTTLSGFLLGKVWHRFNPPLTAQLSNSDCEVLKCANGLTLPLCLADGTKLEIHGDPCQGEVTYCFTNEECGVGHICTTEMGLCLTDAEGNKGGICAGSCLQIDHHHETSDTPPPATEPAPVLAPQPEVEVDGAADTATDLEGTESRVIIAEPEPEAAPETIETMLMGKRIFEPFPEPSKNWFSDTDLKYEGDKAANLLRDKNIISGYPDGTFRAKGLVNRAEAAKMLLTARYGEFPHTVNSGQFYDVKDSDWFVKYVIGAANLGIIKGYNDPSSPSGQVKLFRPGNYINSAEFAKMISKTFNLPTGEPYYFQDVAPSAWYAIYLGYAEKSNLFPTRVRNFEPGRLMTRGEVALAIARVIIAK